MFNKIPYVSNIQRFSVDDGPGIRTTVFLKGCNLHCLWCHNPECIIPGPTLQFDRKLCVSCGRCVNACKNGVHSIDANGVHSIDRTLCTACGKCVAECRNQALALLGKIWEPQALADELDKDLRFFESSGGGITISGGDPMLYPDYLIELLSILKNRGRHVAVDTAGCVPQESFEKVRPLCDLFLYDIKAFTPELHKKLTGVDNAQILKNIAYLSDKKERIFVRVPTIPGCNADLSELDAIAGFLSGLSQAPELIQLLPYHNYGVGKYDMIGTVSQLPATEAPSREFMEQALALFTSRGLSATIS